MAYKTLEDLPRTTRNRIQQTEHRFQTKYALTRHPLEEGMQVRLAGYKNATLDFVEIKDRVLVYQTATDRINRSLELQSKGWRYDIYAAHPLRREEVAELQRAGIISSTFDPDYCSETHAVEIAVYDKWKRTWAYLVWESLGKNRDTVNHPSRLHVTSTLRCTEVYPAAEPADGKTKLRVDARADE